MRRGVSLLLLCLPAAHAQIADYPTLDRVLFVEACLRQHPERPRQEMLYKCACAMDAFAMQVPFDEYVDLATAANATTLSGRRGNATRSAETLAAAGRYRGALALAYESCLIGP